MNSSLTHALQRRLQDAGGLMHGGGGEFSAARDAEPRICPALVMEPPLRPIRCGAATPWETPLAFLDGIQRSQSLGSHGVRPVLGARIAAGVRLRIGRRLQPAVVITRDVVVAPAELLTAFAEWGDRLTLLPLDEAADAHPLAQRDAARAAIERARKALEIEAGSTFRRRHPDTWLVVDGSLTVTPEWASDPRMIGVVKSHTTLPFGGADLERYLTLPVAHRSSMFQPPSQVSPVYAFGLRLREWQGRDLMYGLVRVERPATAASLADADELAARLLVERAPVAADARADRLLYGVHAVERWLGAQA